MSACSTAAPQASAPPGVFHDMLAEAVEMQASPAQIASLERAASSGEMSYADVEALVDDAIECFETAGIQVDRLPPTYTGEGVMIPNFATHDNADLEDGGEAIVYDCSLKNYGLALAAYSSQPHAIDAAHDAFERDRETYIRCLVDHGFDIDETASRDEVNAMLTEDGLRIAQQDLPLEPCSVA